MTEAIHRIITEKFPNELPMEFTKEYVNNYSKYLLMDQ